MTESLPVELQGADPIFILGIMPRSGTNYLWDLVCLHPHCGQARSPIREDFFLEASDHLLAYTKEVREWWDPMWGSLDEGLMEVFHESLGEGLVSFLWVDRQRRLVTKSPSVRHIDRFFKFFPRARLLVLVRDGRSVVQSSMATFGWDFDRAARQWAAAADEIRRFELSGRSLASRWMLVRYEDLLNDLEGSLSRVFRFLELDEKVFDLEAASSLPVRGSSFFLGLGHDSIHWEPVEKDADFDPRERWRSWSPRLHERFEWIAGRQLRYLGYEDADNPIQATRSVIRHRILDWSWQTKQAVRSGSYRARVRLGTASRPLRQRLGLVRTRP
jgi:hypothetical protein